ncbi:MAG: hypothetical protein LBC89_06195 [Bacteroidales bacterium]|jgi:hypothetical protein|nr:hypothetical protein [Bacteroidales bacterium]
MKKISSLLAAFICFAMMNLLSAQQTVWHKQLRVNPKPIVTMLDATVCENDSIDIYFYGRIDDNVTPGQHKFTLTCTIDVANNPGALNGTDVLPAVVGLPTVFSLTPSAGEGQLYYVSGPDNVTAASTYYARIAANAPGEFTFKLDGVQDDKCYNDTNKTATITVTPKPAVAIDTTGADICLNSQRIFTFSAATAPYPIRSTITTARITSF